MTGLIVSHQGWDIVQPVVDAQNVVYDSRAMIEKEPDKNQTSPVSPISPGLRLGMTPRRIHDSADGRQWNGGARPGAGRKPGVPNKITTTFRDALLQARCS
jgi:hypothetical protein